VKLHRFTFRALKPCRLGFRLARTFYRFVMAAIWRKFDRILLGRTCQ
jgi:hypothetical protein